MKSMLLVIAVALCVPSNAQSSAEKVGKDLWRQVYHVTYTKTSGEAIEGPHSFPRHQFRRRPCVRKKTRLDDRGHAP